MLKALKVLLKDKTAIIIAHRLSTIRHAGQIIVMDNGKIVQQGNRDEFIKQKGIYHDSVKIRNEAIDWKL